MKMNWEKVSKDVPAWGNAGTILNEHGISWDVCLIDQIKTKNPYSGTETVQDGIFYHFMSADREVAIWSPLFKNLRKFEPPRVWGQQMILECRVAGHNWEIID